MTTMDTVWLDLTDPDDWARFKAMPGSASDVPQPLSFYRGRQRATRATLDDEDDELIRAMDRNQLKDYWTKGEGLAKWIGHPHPWTALFHHLRKYVGSERAKRMASEWFHDVTGLWSGERKGKNPVGPG